MKRLLGSLVLALVVFTSTDVLAKRKGGDSGFQRGGRSQSGQYDPRQADEQNQNPGSDVAQNDSQIVDLVQRKKGAHYVEGGNMIVTRVLPDDTQGLQHQKWMVRLSNGKEVMAVYNSDMCERVPVRVGDVISMGGEFIWTPQGGLIHWLHHDPRQRRPDGYVELAGKFYCN